MIIQEIQLLTTYNYDFIINERYYDLQLETALCYQHYFCNTELRTATVTKIKGLSIQTQQNTFVLFTLFKLTLDERKTLTKISMRKTSHNLSPHQHTLRTTKKQGENQYCAPCSSITWYLHRPNFTGSMAWSSFIYS